MTLANTKEGPNLTMQYAEVGKQYNQRLKSEYEEMECIVAKGNGTVMSMKGLEKVNFQQETYSLAKMEAIVKLVDKYKVTNRGRMN